jgi:hypothetical protein
MIHKHLQRMKSNTDKYRHLLRDSDVFTTGRKPPYTVGEKINKVTILSEEFSRVYPKCRRRAVAVECECGKVWIALTSDIRNRGIRACKSCSNSDSSTNRVGTLACDGYKVCAACKQSLPVADYHKKKKEAKDGLSHVCKLCHYLRRIYFSYKVTPDQYARLVSLHDGGCHICKTLPDPGQRLCVDHCHETNRVRGLLCHRCNKAIGLLRDGYGLCLNAATYLSQPVHLSLEPSAN